MSEGSMLLVILDEANQTEPDDRGRTLLEDWKKAEVKREAKNPVLFIAAIFVFDKILFSAKAASPDFYDCLPRYFGGKSHRVVLERKKPKC